METRRILLAAEVEVKRCRLAAEASMWRAGDLCDVHVVAGGTTFRAHRVVLAAASPFFRRLFASGMRDATARAVTLVDVDPAAFARVLELVYTGEVHVGPSDLSALIDVLQRLDMQSALRECAALVDRALEPATAAITWELARLHGMDAVADKALSMVCANFGVAASHTSFLQVSGECLADLLRRDALRSDETTIFLALVRWLRHDLPNRRPLANSLLACVRFPLMDPSCLLDCVCADPLVTGVDCWPDIWREAQAAQGRTDAPVSAGADASAGACAGAPWLCPAEPPPDIATDPDHTMPAAMPRHSVRSGPGDGHIFSVGGTDGPRVMQTVQRYSLSSGRWEAVPPMSTPRLGLGVAFCQAFLYAVGGTDGTRHLASAERLCPQAGAWEAVAPMSCARSHVGVAAIGGAVYAVGGRDYSHALRTVERFDVEAGEWHAAAPMSIPRYHVRVAVVRGKLYAIGGGEQSRLGGRTTAERYNPTADHWEEVPPLSTVREGVGIAAVDGRLFAIGGFDGKDKLRSVECFCPRRGTWETVAPMKMRRMCHRVAVLGRHIYVIGGYHGTLRGSCRPQDTHGRLTSVERFSVDTGEWEEAPSMSADAAKRESRWNCHGGVIGI